MNQQKPFAFFQRHPTSRIWQEVIAGAAGEPGVVAAFLEGAAAPSGEVQPDDLQWIADQHAAIKTHHTHEFGEGPATLHPDAISDALRQGLARGHAAAHQFSMETVSSVLHHANPTFTLNDHLEHIDAAVFTGDTLYDDERREEIKTYVGRWTRAIAEHEAADAEEAGAATALAVEEPVAEAKAEVAIDDVHAALRAAGLMLVRTEHGLVIEKALNAVAEQAAPAEDQSEDEPEAQPAHVPTPVLTPLSRVEQVGWSYTEEGGKKYLVRDRREGEKVAHMVEGVLYEGKPIDGVPEIIQRLGEWLHAAYDRTPQSPEAVAMLDSIDALTAVRQHVFMPAGAEPAAEVRSLTNQYGTMKAAFLIDKSLPDGTRLFVGKEAPGTEA